MAYFFCRLLPPRSTFPSDMNDMERKGMEEHVDYWMKYIEKGKVLALGPVADPKGTWGLGIFQVDNDAEIRNLTAQDPIIRSGLGFRYEIFPMPRLMFKQ